MDLMNLWIVLVAVDSETVRHVRAATFANLSPKPKDRHKTIRVVRKKNISHRLDGLGISVGPVRVAIVERGREVLLPIRPCEIDGTDEVHVEPPTKEVHERWRLVDFALLDDNHPRVSVPALFFLDRWVDEGDGVLGFRIRLHLPERHGERPNEVFFPVAVPVENIKFQRTFHVSVVQPLHRNLEWQPGWVERFSDIIGLVARIPGAPFLRSQDSEERIGLAKEIFFVQPLPRKPQFRGQLHLPHLLCGHSDETILPPLR